jgi:hypothetical protein
MKLRHLSPVLVAATLDSESLLGRVVVLQVAQARG